MCTQCDKKVTQPEVLHLLLARNVCDKVTARTRHVTQHHLSSGFKSVHLPTYLSHKCSMFVLLNTFFNLSPI
jgi:hypothetical protein